MEGLGLTFIAFLFILHLINYVALIIIKGIHRYRMIDKYRYDYYDTRPLGFHRKLLHHINHVLFLRSTFFGTFFLVGIECLVLYLLKPN